MALPHPPALPRVASLLPAATEIACALGAREQLVGISHECDHPGGLAGLPVLTRSRVAAGGGARIHAEVAALVRQALAVFEVDERALAAARPDVVLTQDLCDVCAVALPDVQRAVHAVLGPHVRIESLRPTRLEDLWRDIATVGAALGREQRASTLVAELQARVAHIGARAAALAERPRVLTLEWLEPPMVGGTWMPDLIELAGGRALAARAGEGAPVLAPEALARLAPAPEVVLVKPCGFSLERTLAERAQIRALLDPMPWPAVRTGRIWLADGNAYFNRPGPRLVESLEILAACTHPAAFADLARKHAAAFLPLHAA